MVSDMAECLQQGEILAIFPEGTTGDGAQVLPFHANLLQAAIAAQQGPREPVMSTGAPRKQNLITDADIEQAYLLDRVQHHASNH
jgi:1-acyl-sn-glycerol-3-phosphate acyltransferase